jgi:serine/threonine-protein kinase
VRTILARGTVRDAAPELQPLLGGFDSLFVMTADARILEQWPAAASYVYQRDYTFRDYFRGARYLAETRTPGAYIARAFRSESHGTLEFGISAPVLDEQGTQLGLIVGTLQANSVFGAVRMEEAPQSGKTGRIITALIGPRGHDRASGPEAPAPSDFTFLVHPRMDRGVEYPVRTPSPERLRQRFGLSAPPGHQLSLQYAPALQIADYHDPIPGFPGDWLAALAPVGKTGFLMLVETPKETALPWPRALRGPFASRAVPRLAFLIAIAGGLLLGATIRRARRRRTRSG